MNRVLIVAGLLTTAILSFTPIKAMAEESIRIGCWNIQHLDSDSRQTPEAIAEYVQLANIQLLALEEIHDTDDDEGTITNEKLDQTFQLINDQSGQDWHYVLFPDRDGVDRDQHTGVAWNSRVLTKKSEPLKINVAYDNEETWKRTPHALKFSAGEGKTDFVVIVLHMKSNNEVDNLPGSREIRELEAKALTAKLSEVSMSLADSDLILLGDTNCLKAEEPSLVVYTHYGFRDLNGADCPTYRSFFQGEEHFSPFDRILVKPSQPEFTGCRQYVMTPADRKVHFDELSDHFMAITSLVVAADDD